MVCYCIQNINCVRQKDQETGDKKHCFASSSFQYYLLNTIYTHYMIPRNPAIHPCFAECGEDRTEQRGTAAGQLLTAGQLWEREPAAQPDLLEDLTPTVTSDSPPTVFEADSQRETSEFTFKLLRLKSGCMMNVRQPKLFE